MDCLLIVSLENLFVFDLNSMKLGRVLVHIDITTTSPIFIEFKWKTKKFFNDTISQRLKSTFFMKCVAMCNLNRPFFSGVFWASQFKSGRILCTEFKKHDEFLQFPWPSLKFMSTFYEFARYFLFGSPLLCLWVKNFCFVLFCKHLMFSQV